MNRIILALLVASILHIGCKKEKTDQTPCIDYHFIKDCPPLYIPISFFKGYDTTDVDTVTLTTYARGQQFSNPTGSAMFIKKYEQVSSNDFLAIKDIRITDSLDYMIEVPAIHKQYYISAGPVPHLVDTVWCDEFRGERAQCYSWSEYFVVNGDTVQPYRYGNFDLVLLLNK